MTIIESVIGAGAHKIHKIHDHERDTYAPKQSKSNEVIGPTEFGLEFLKALILRVGI